MIRSILSLRFLLPFIPLFVAFDVPGILPIFVSMTSEMTEPERKKVVRQSSLTGFLVSVGFLAVGKSVFSLMGISINDFKVAGGILLFILAVVDLIFPERTRTFPKETMGVVPIGIPLIVGPAVLTMLIITVDAYGIVPTLFCLVANLVIVGLAFGYSPYVMRFLREGGAKGVAKVAALLLAAYAVMMIRTGLGR